MDLLEHLAPLWLTLKVATLATGLALAAGVGVGWLLARKRFWGREWLDALASLPLVMPPTVLGYYLIVVLGRNGWLGHWLHAKLGITLMFTWQGAVIAAAVSALPLVLKSARAAIEGVDTRLEQAARVLGAAEIAVAWTVTLPLALRGIVAGTLLAYARAMGEYGATLMIAGDIPGRTQTLSMAVFDPAPTDVRRSPGRAWRKWGAPPGCCPCCPRTA
ncbi:molybdate ABC transporter permease subunit [Acidithiobacillus sulfuriphilus]|uniref:Molybdenum transport system permease n=2 Tax=Acidithiobacillus sulfuriphilus TaxID=1867749 RepID=A0A3M8RVZ9_9PROT|nr:molybdate ABC transporter permease subunit [Acidithiobacillus sulfuriphilus]RNF72667.1 molybdate ABC transporter permease subunit [Acidithiobacillus sulfuriphilus]